MSIGMVPGRNGFGRGAQGRVDAIDRLPPHSEEAEQGVLGCCLLGGGPSVEQALERFALEGGRTREVFFDLRHQWVFEVLCKLHLEGKADAPMDLILVTTELRARNVLDQVGGLHFLTSLMDAVPSVQNLPHYLGIVWDAFLARDLVRTTTEISTAVMERGGITEGGITRVERVLEDWKGLATRGTGITPQDLKRPGEFGDGVLDHWFKGKVDELPGLDLPIAFPLKIRPNEYTLFTGEDKSGKSIFLGQVAAVLMKQGWKGCMASLEVTSATTLWMLTRQLLGAGPKLPQTAENEKRVCEAMGFLNSRLWMYDFVGITDWRQLLDVMRYARAKEGVDFFIVDSIMRIGIHSDDLTTQDLAAAEFAGFAVNTGAHVFLVQHLNKSKEGGLKDKITGSKRWSDNANNIVQMQRNKKKGEGIAKVESEFEARLIEEAEYKSRMAELRTLPDGRFVLENQRYPGSVQNGAKWMWFDPGSLQFRDRYDDRPTDYLL